MPEQSQTNQPSEIAKIVAELLGQSLPSAIESAVKPLQDSVMALKRRQKEIDELTPQKIEKQVEEKVAVTNADRIAALEKERQIYQTRHDLTKRSAIRNAVNSLAESLNVPLVRRKLFVSHLMNTQKFKVSEDMESILIDNALEGVDLKTFGESFLKTEDGEPFRNVRQLPPNAPVGMGNGPGHYSQSYPSVGSVLKQGQMLKDLTSAEIEALTPEQIAAASQQEVLNEQAGQR